MPESSIDELHDLSRRDLATFSKQAIKAYQNSSSLSEEERDQGEMHILEHINREDLEGEELQQYEALLRAFFSKNPMGLHWMLTSTPDLLEQPFFTEQLPKPVIESLIMYLSNVTEINIRNALIRILENQKLEEPLKTHYEATLNSMITKT
jgi:hypothetical protein